MRNLVQLLVVALLLGAAACDAPTTTATKQGWDSENPTSDLAPPDLVVDTAVEDRDAGPEALDRSELRDSPMDLIKPDRTDSDSDLTGRHADSRAVDRFDGQMGDRVDAAPQPPDALSSDSAELITPSDATADLNDDDLPEQQTEDDTSGHEIDPQPDLSDLSDTEDSSDGDFVNPADMTIEDNDTSRPDLTSDGSQEIVVVTSDTLVPLDARFRGMTLAHIDDDEDQDPDNDGKRGYGTKTSMAALTALKGLGVRWVALNVFGLLDDLCDSSVTPEWDSPGQENQTAIRAQIQQIHQLGMSVYLVPSIWVLTGDWRGHLGFCATKTWNAVNWANFFASYGSFIGWWADFAEAEKVGLFSVGLELKSAAVAWPDEFRVLIGDVRTRYSGPLTYSANWDSAFSISFWDALDLVGIDAYYPLTAFSNATAGQLLTGALNLANALEKLALATNRRILFTEIGYLSQPDSALAPSVWPAPGGLVDEEHQRDAYAAVFGALWNRSWFAGMFWWKCFSDPEDLAQTEFPPQEGPNGYSPCGKLAADVLEQYYLLP